MVTGSDDDVNRSGGMPPAEAARALAAQPGFARASRSYGPVAAFAAPSDTLDPAARLPEVRRYDVPASRGLVRVEPAAPATVVDGSAAGVGDLASLGGLPRGRPLLYAGDLGADQIRRAAAAGGEVVVSDSNRRRVFVASRPRQSYGWTLPASVPFSADAAVLDPFGRGPDAQTVAVYEGAASVRAPFSPQIAQFPEHRPFAAFDGDVATTWIADPTLDDPRHWVEAKLPAPRDIPYVDVLPDASNPLVVVTRVDVGGRSFAVHPGWNRLPVRLRGATSVRVTITGHRTLGMDAGSVGGIREVRVPGLHVRELLRPPVAAERALAGQDLTHTPLTYVFERTTADDPLRRGPEPPASSFTGNRAEDEAALVRTAVDPGGGARPGVLAAGGAILAGGRMGDGRAVRASTASSTGWPACAGGACAVRVGPVPGPAGAGARRRRSTARARRRGPPLASRRPAVARVADAATETLVRRLVLSRSPLPARFPTSVRLVPGRANAGAGGGWRRLGELPQPVRARSFRLDVLAAGGSTRPAVAIGGGARRRGPAGDRAALGRAARSGGGHLGGAVGRPRRPPRCAAAPSHRHGRRRSTPAAPCGRRPCGARSRCPRARMPARALAGSSGPLTLRLRCGPDPGGAGRGRAPAACSTRARWAAAPTTACACR